MSDRMKKLVILCAALVLAGARPQQRYQSDDARTTILQQLMDNFPDGSYTYSFKTSNGLEAEEKGVPVSNGAVIKSGSNSYVDYGETSYKIAYVADEGGYRPVGSHLPTPPPTPEAILKALKYIREHPPVIKSKYPGETPFKREIIGLEPPLVR